MAFRKPVFGEYMSWAIPSRVTNLDEVVIPDLERVEVEIDSAEYRLLESLHEGQRSGYVNHEEAHRFLLRAVRCDSGSSLGQDQDIYTVQVFDVLEQSEQMFVLFDYRLNNFRIQLIQDSDSQRL